MVTRLYLVRHAQAKGNIDGTFQGSIDTPLCEQGLQELPCLTERFAGVPLDKIYTSPLRRAVQTALAVRGEREIPVIQRDGLREIACGSWEGAHWDTLKTQQEALYRVWRDTPHSFEAPGGETMAEVFDRMKRTLLEIVRESFGQTVAVVSHGCALRNYLCHAYGYPVGQLGQMEFMGHTGVTCVECDEYNRPSILYENDLSHLTAI